MGGGGFYRRKRLPEGSFLWLNKNNSHRIFRKKYIEIEAFQNTKQELH